MDWACWVQPGGEGGSEFAIEGANADDGGKERTRVEVCCLDGGEGTIDTNDKGRESVGVG